MGLFEQRKIIFNKYRKFQNDRRDRELWRQLTR